MCPLDFDLIIKITCFTDAEVTNPDMYLDRSLTELSSIPVSYMPTEGETEDEERSLYPGMTLVTKFESIKFSQSDTYESSDRKLKNTIKYDSVHQGVTHKKILEQTKELSLRHYHLLLETISGHRFWLPSNPDAKFSSSQEGNTQSSTIVIENLCGPLQITQ